MYRKLCPLAAKGQTAAYAIVYDSTQVKAPFVYGLELVRRLHLFEGVVGRANERA
jgi:hypothetical protein